MKFNVTYFKINERDNCPMINIETEDIKGKDSFTYCNISGMYDTISTQGVGIQVNDFKLEKQLLKMCNTIAQAIYDYKKEIKC